MSNPVIDAFFLGRAFAEVLSEKLEDAYTNTMSELGKFDAEQREHLRQFIEEVQLRAKQTSTTNVEPTNTARNPNNNTVGNDYNFSNAESPGDLQEMLDQLRAEIASLRAELNKYRNQ